MCGSPESPLPLNLGQGSDYMVATAWLTVAALTPEKASTVLLILALTYRVLTRLSSFNLVNFIIRDQGASWRDSA